MLKSEFFVPEAQPVYAELKRFLHGQSDLLLTTADHLNATGAEQVFIREIERAAERLKELVP
jgi:hypothetical protein